MKYKIFLIEKKPELFKKPTLLMFEPGQPIPEPKIWIDEIQIIMDNPKEIEIGEMISAFPKYCDFEIVPDVLFKKKNTILLSASRLLIFRTKYGTIQTAKSMKRFKRILKGLNKMADAPELVEPQPDIIPTITRKLEGARGCGYRKPGGTYLISDGLGFQCGKLPVPLHVCPACGNGIKFSRGFTWIEPQSLFPKLLDCLDCPGCFIQSSKETAGLLWVGEKFYSPHEFLMEASNRGISRRIQTVPHKFKIGKTWVYFAHKKAIKGNGNIGDSPGVFSAFVPTRIEYVITGNESEAELMALAKRGLTLVDVTREQTEMKI